VDVVPVFNKSHREHLIVGSKPTDTRAAADAAVAELGWNKAYFVDADHIGIDVVDEYLEAADFFTIDVTEAIGRPADERNVEEFLDRHPELIGELRIPGIETPLRTDVEEMKGILQRYLEASTEAGQVYRHIEQGKGKGGFLTEVSMDEATVPQTPMELLTVLAALSDEGIPLQTIAPKFPGSFFKGIDYIGDLDQFAREFRADLAVISHASSRYPLPSNLKISVHSGSDKFSIFPIIRECLKEFEAGLHLKTAGTTWLEQLAGLATGRGEGLLAAKEIYGQAYERKEELIAPYAQVVEIDPARLPEPTEVSTWPGERFAASLRHDTSCPEYNIHFRQLLHTAYKIAAEMGERFFSLLETHQPAFEDSITQNIYRRHLRPLFIGGGSSSGQET
jgi:hypothetical protein